MWQKNVSFGHAQLMVGGRERATLKSLPVCGALNEKFPNVWIGRGGPIHWPPRSPDLTPMDFFVGIREELCV
jgi:hypothetical protein